MTGLTRRCATGRPAAPARESITGLWLQGAPLLRRGRVPVNLEGLTTPPIFYACRATAAPTLPLHTLISVH